MHSCDQTIGSNVDVLFDDKPIKSSHQWPDPIMNFLVAYDIADPKRLRLVAKQMESSARRVQKSVFVFTGSRRELDDLMSGTLQYIEPSEDRIQAWPVRTSTRSQRVDIGLALPETGIAVVVAPDGLTIVEAIDDIAATDHPPLIIT